jgi:DNA-binding SARP family transcriptional activator
MSTTGWGLARAGTLGSDQEVQDALRAMRLRIGEALVHLEQGARMDVENDLNGAMAAYEELAGRLSEESRPQSPPEVAVQTLGSFRVLLSGSPITNSDWKSRKARTLLKVLISRYGGPVNREVLMEILWSGEEPAKSASRLSVALSTLRGVLGRSKAHDGDYVVAANRTSVWLRLEHIDVDLMEFMSAARRGLQTRRNGHRGSATRSLERAEAVYRGGFLEEDAYEDWVVGSREEARATYREVLFALAEDALAAGQFDAAMRRHREILEMDSYDERAYLGLIRELDDTGHHGEARRCYGRYRARMQEIGLAIAPFPHSKDPP